MFENLLSLALLFEETLLDLGGILRIGLTFVLDLSANRAAKIGACVAGVEAAVDHQLAKQLGRVLVHHDAGEYSRSGDFQRDTVRANGIMNLPWSFSVSGSYLYGSGTYRNATLNGRPYGKPGTNRLNLGGPITIPADVLDRWDGPAVIATGSVWPRNALKGLPLHKVDLRVSKIIRMGGDLRATLLAEVFNVFNWKNYGNYNKQLDSPTFGQPTAASGNAYTPRSGQLGFRFEF